MRPEPPEGWPAYFKAKVTAELAEAQARHVQVCAGLDGALLAVAQFHHPIEGTKQVLCHGCDHHWEDSVLDWPCPTWELIENG